MADKRIAVCFSGQLRTSAAAMPNMLRFVGDLLPSCDFFMHTWNINQTKTYEGRTNPSYPTSVEDLEKVRNGYGVRMLLMENHDVCVERFKQDFGISFISKSHPDYHSNSVSPSWIPQFWSCYQSNLLRRDWEIISGTRYDVVVRMRPDLIFPRYRSLEKEIDHWRKNQGYFIVENLSGEMINDVMWISSPELMDLASMFWRRKMDNADPSYTLATYFGEVGIRCMETSEFGMVPLRESVADINVLEEFSIAFVEDVKLYPYHRLGEGTIDDWMQAAADWLRTT